MEYRKMKKGRSDCGGGGGIQLEMGGGRTGKGYSETRETNSLLEGIVLLVMSGVDTIALPLEDRDKIKDLRAQAQVILERPSMELLFSTCGLVLARGHWDIRKQNDGFFFF